MKCLNKILSAILFIIASAFSNSAPAWYHGSPSVNTGGVLMNAANSSYFSGYSPFVNWWLTGQAPVLISSVNGTLNGQQIFDCPLTSPYIPSCTTPSTYMDSKGELLGSAGSPLPADVVSLTKLFFAPVTYPSIQYEGTSYTGLDNQVWDVSWTGCATPTVSLVGNPGTGGTSSFGSNSGTITFGTSPGNVSIRFTLTAGCYTNPPRNITVSQHQYAANVAACPTNRIKCFNPSWLADVKPFGIIRLMDLMVTNGGGIRDSSQLADWTNASLTKPLLGTYASGSTIAGTVFTAGSTSSDARFRIGSILYGQGITAGAVTIASFGTGTGGNGTYNLTCSGGCPTVSTPEDIVGMPPVGANGDFGTKGGLSTDVACALGQATGAIIEYPMPVTATNQFATDIATAFKACGIIVKYSYGNEDWNSGFLQYRYMQAQHPIVGNNYIGYRAAQLAEVIYGVYGVGNRSRWISTVGSQGATPSVDAAIISGINSWVSGGSALTLNQMFDQMDVALYTGNTFTGPAITNITIGATPTITTGTSHGFSNGQVIKQFVTSATGTVSGALNNQYATVSSVTSTTYVINISTAGLTYSNPGCPSACTQDNFAVDATLYKLADQSAALNISTPVTYPTKFSYYVQQMAISILTGSATDASFGTLITPAFANLSNAASAIPDLMAQHALNANSYGMNLRQYEGGNATSYVGPPLGNIPAQMNEYFNNWQFDAGVVGDTSCSGSPCNEAAVYAANFQVFRNVNSAYSAQFNDAQTLSQFGPWGALRYLPGDEANIKWQSLVTENARGPFAPTYPATPAAPYTGAAFPMCNTTTGNTQACVVNGFGTAAGYAIIGLALQAGTIVSVDVDGTSLNFDNGLLVASGIGAYALFSGPVPVGSLNRTVNVTYSGAAFQAKTTAPYKITGNSTSAAQSTALGSASISISVTKNVALICMANFVSGTPNWTAGLNGVIPAASQSNGTRGSTALFVPPFSNPSFNPSMGTVSAVSVCGTYR